MMTIALLIGARDIHSVKRSNTGNLEQTNQKLCA